MRRIVWIKIRTDLRARREEDIFIQLCRRRYGDRWLPARRSCSLYGFQHSSRVRLKVMHGAGHAASNNSAVNAGVRRRQCITHSGQPTSPKQRNRCFRDGTDRSRNYPPFRIVDGCSEISKVTVPIQPRVIRFSAGIL